MSQPNSASNNEAIIPINIQKQLILKSLKKYIANFQLCYFLSNEAEEHASDGGARKNVLLTCKHKRDDGQLKQAN